MFVYCIFMGTLSALYYILIACYTKKLNATFSLCWIAFALIHVLIGFLIPETVLELWIWGAFALGWIVFFVVGIPIVLAMFQKERKGLSFIIVLGAQIRGIRITNSLYRRLGRACRYLRDNPETVAIVSGGQGPGEDISEAEAMAGFLRGKGILEERILREDKSTSTWENLAFTKELIADVEFEAVPIGIVSNGFHIYRSLWLGRAMGYGNLYGISATSNPILLPNYFVREVVAIIVMKAKSKFKK
ncbi:MAG: YdcF family protein [Lachnospiraceae bacterium]|nr:YdcF family protein [Lachnospiraceae bacterium]